MDINEKTSNLIENGTAALTGGLAFVKESTRKYEATPPPQGYGLLSKWRLEDALASVVGKDMVLKIDPAYQGFPQPPSLHPLNVINKTSLTGIALLVGEAIAKEFWAGYKKLPIIPEVIHGAGLGLGIGGAVGGLFDPAPQAPRQGANVIPMTQTGVTNGLPVYEFTGRN